MSPIGFGVSEGWAIKAGGVYWVIHNGKKQQHAFFETHVREYSFWQVQKSLRDYPDISLSISSNMY